MGFDTRDSALLFAIKGVGPPLVSRLEQLGVSCFGQLVQVGSQERVG